MHHSFYIKLKQIVHCPYEVFCIIVEKNCFFIVSFNKSLLPVWSGLYNRIPPRGCFFIVSFSNRSSAVNFSVSPFYLEVTSDIGFNGLTLKGAFLLILKVSIGMCKVKPPWPDLSATQSAEGLQGVSNLVFHGHGLHWGIWPVLSLAASPSTELKNPVYSFRAESTRWPPIWRSMGFEPRTSEIAVQHANH